MRRIIRGITWLPRRFARKFREAIGEDNRSLSLKRPKPSLVANLIDATVRTFRRDKKE